MVLIATECREVNISLEGVLEQLAKYYSILKIFNEWPLKNEKEDLIKEIREK